MNGFSFAWPARPLSEDWLRMFRAGEKALTLCLHTMAAYCHPEAALVALKAADEGLLSWEDAAGVGR